MPARLLCWCAAVGLAIDDFRSLIRDLNIAAAAGITSRARKCRANALGALKIDV
jgi:hypothetical protein